MFIIFYVIDYYIVENLYLIFNDGINLFVFIYK